VPGRGAAGANLLRPARFQLRRPRDRSGSGGGILDAFGGYDYVVVPSGSCGGMLKQHLPSLFDDDPNRRAKADALAARTFELVSFLTDVMGVERLADRYRGGPVTFHDGCCGLREMGVKQQPRRLLESMGATIVEMTEPEICCGFAARSA